MSSSGFCAASSSAASSSGVAPSIHYKRTQAYLKSEEQKGSVFIICPKEPILVGRLSHDPQAIIRAYEMGRRDAQEVSKNLLRWIA